MGKTVLILAPIVVVAAVLLLAFWLGRLFEQAKQRLAAEQLSPVVFYDLVRLMKRVLHPTDLDQVSYVPAELRAEAEGVLAAAVENQRNIEKRRVRRR